MDNYTFTVRKKDSGWQIILSYRDSRGRWRQISKQGFTKRSQALSASVKRDLLSKMKKTANVPENMKDITLAEFYQVFAQESKKTLTYNTLKNYRITIDRVPSLAKKRMVDITYADVVHAINSLNLSASSVNLSIAKLKVLFKYAANIYHLFPVSPIRDLPYVKDRKSKKITALTQEEFSDLLKCMKNEKEEYYVVCAIAGYAGLRFGEIAGLTKADIDFFAGVIHVNKQYGMVARGLYKIREPKTRNSYRDVPIPQVLLNILINYLEDRKAVRMDRRIFNVRESSYVNSRIKKYYPDCSVHQLRHTYATTLLANGLDVKTVSALIGDTVAMVIKTYIHYTDAMRKKAKKDVSRIFG